MDSLNESKEPIGPKKILVAPHEKQQEEEDPKELEAFLSIIH